MNNSFQHDVQQKVNEKLIAIADFFEKKSAITKEAEWLINNGIPQKSWDKQTSSEKNNIIRSIHEGDYIPIVDDFGKPIILDSSGEESIVFPALGSPKSGFQDTLFPNQKYNAVVKQQKTNIDPKFKDQYLFKKNLQGNLLNRLILPLNDFEGAGNNRIASEFLFDPLVAGVNQNTWRFSEKAQEFNDGVNILRKWLPQNLKVNPFSELYSNLGSELNLPTLVDKNGNFYLISDLYAGKATSKYLNIPSGFKNIGLNRYGKFRAMDFLATPVTTKAIEIYKQYLNALKKSII